MTTIKIYSQNKLKISGHSPTTIHTYNIRDGVKNNGMAYMAYSEFNTDDYNRTRAELEKEGFVAHPYSDQEIENRIYTIFREAL
jgi:hypothetical protein